VIFNHIGGGAGIAGRPGHGLVTLDEVNAMSLERFAEVFGPLVQGSPWVLERAFAQRPFADTIALRTALHDAVMSGDPAEQQQLLDSFADLGGEHDGRDDAYALDHAGADALDDETRAEVHELAVAFRERFGFPLIVSARDVGDRYERVLTTG